MLPYDAELLELTGAYEEALYLLRVAYERLVLSHGDEVPEARDEYFAAVEQARAVGGILRELRQGGTAS